MVLSPSFPHWHRQVGFNYGFLKYRHKKITNKYVVNNPINLLFLYIQTNKCLGINYKDLHYKHNKFRNNYFVK